MTSIKDILDVPLSELKEGIKLWVDHSCIFWEEWVKSKNISTAFEAAETKDEKETTEEPVVEEKKIPDDLAAVLEYNKAIVEKYQATGAESLLKHLVLQLAKERKVNLTDLLDDVNQTIEEVLTKEIKDVIDVSDAKRELLNVDVSNRAEFIIKRVLENNSDAVDKILNGDKEIIKELDQKAVEAAHDTVKESDLKFALRAMIQAELIKRRQQ